MPTMCSAVGCLSQQGDLMKFKKISFHKFPQWEGLKQKWLRNMKRADWTPSKRAKLCSLHFEPSCYRKGSKKSLLHPFAEPTIFKNQTPLKEKYPGGCSRTSQTQLQIDVPEGEDIIASVYQYLQLEYEYLNSFIGSNCDLSSLANILARTAKATGASEETVTAVLKKRRKRLSYSEDKGPQEKQSKLDHYFDETDVSPIVVDSSSESADEDHREDDEGQIQQEEHETGTLKLEFEVEPEELCGAVRGRPQPPPHETTTAVHHVVPPTYTGVMIEPINEEYQPTTIAVHHEVPPTYAVVKIEPINEEYQPSSNAVLHEVSTYAEVQIEPVDEEYQPTEPCADNAACHATRLQSRSPIELSPHTIVPPRIDISYFQISHF